MNKIKKLIKSNFKRKLRITQGLLVAFLLSGILVYGEDAQPQLSPLNITINNLTEKTGLELGDKSYPRGEGSITTSRNGISIGNGAVATGGAENKEENRSAIYTSFWSNVGKSHSKKWVKSTRNETDYGKFRAEYNKNAKNDGSDIGNAIDYGKRVNRDSSGWIRRDKEDRGLIGGYNDGLRTSEISTNIYDGAESRVNTSNNDKYRNGKNNNDGLNNFGLGNNGNNSNSHNVSAKVDINRRRGLTDSTIFQEKDPKIVLTAKDLAEVKVIDVSVKTPENSEAPNFNVFTRARGQESGGSQWNSMFNNFDRSIQRWNSGETIDGTNISINDAPMIAADGQDIYGKGVDKSYITATTDDNGVITNEYKDIATNQVIPEYYPTNSWFSPATLLTSRTSFPKVEANTFYSAKDEGQGEDDLTPENNKYKNKMQQTWIFQSAPNIVKDLTINMGGINSPFGTAGYHTNKINLENVNLNLKGKTVLGVLSPNGNYSVNFKNTNVNVAGNYNTLFNMYINTIENHIYWNSTDARNENLHWGIYRGDVASDEVGINMGSTNISLNTKNNNIFRISPTQNWHRWNGHNNIAKVPSGLPSGGTTYPTNPGKYLMAYPVVGNIKFKNSGDINFIGADNVGVWSNGFVYDRRNIIAGATKEQELNLGKINMSGDKNNALYFANGNQPQADGIFNGKVNVDAEIGTTLDGTVAGTSQIEAGNINEPTKVEKNIALFVASGQNEKRNMLRDGYRQFYPATLSFTIDNLEHPNGRIYGLTVGDDIGAWQLGDQNNLKDPIKNLKLENFNVKFGKYAKDNIAVVAKNGSYVELNPIGVLNDNAEIGAEENTFVFAEGVWKDNRLALTTDNYDKEAYGRGESRTGQKFLSDFNTKVDVQKDLTMNSVKSTGLIAKDGANITAKNIIMNGYGSKGAFAIATKDYADIVDSNNSNTGVQPTTKIVVDNITANTNGTEVNTNMGAIAISKDENGQSTGDVEVVVNGKIEVKGLGAFAKGDKAKVTVNGNNSVIEAGDNSALVALDGGIINFGGGTIEHKIDNQKVFHSNEGSKINFNGATTINIYKGLAFNGEKDEYSAGTGNTAYNGMQNVTINLMDNGVDLGIIKGDLTWKGNTDATYTDEIANTIKVRALNTNGYFYKSALENGSLSIEADVDRDNITTGANRGDGFNDIKLERERVVLKNGSTINSSLGNGLALGSNSKAISNSESGYTLEDGKVKITSTQDTVGIYTNFGHIINKDKGSIEVNKGVAAQGVNGSKIVNNGEIKVTENGAGIVGLAKTINGTETYGVVAGRSNDNFIDIKNNGNITVNDGIGIYAKNNVGGITKDKIRVHNEGTINVGDNGKGIVIQTDDNVGSTLTLKEKATNDIIVGNNGIGIHAESSNVSIDGNYGISIGDKGIAIQTKGNTNITGDSLNITTNGSGAGISFIGNNETLVNDVDITLNGTGSQEVLTGIYAKGTGKVENIGNIASATDRTYGILSKGIEIGNTGNIDVKADGIFVDGNNIVNSGSIKAGDSSMGLANINANKLENTGIIQVGNGTSTEDSVAIYGKDVALIKNINTLKLKNNGIGIYGENSTIENTGDIISTGSVNYGIYSNNSEVNNRGNIVVGENSNGIFSTSNVINTGNITTGDKSSGIFTKGTANIDTTGITTVGKGSIGLYSENGDITNNSNIIAGTDSTYIYSKNGNIINNYNFNLSDRSLGVYASNGKAINNGIIKLGNSDLTNEKISIGMVTDKGIIENNSKIILLNKDNIGMFADSGTAINKANGSILVDGENSFGMFGTNGATLINEGSIDVNGKDSKGILATKNSKVLNTGIINVNGVNAEGIFVEKGSTVTNTGVISINSSTGYGIISGTNGNIQNSGTINVSISGASPTRESGINVGGIKINGNKAFIDNIELNNSGIININAPLDFNEIKLGATNGNIGTINAESFEKGKFLILPEATLGTNKDKYDIQYLQGFVNAPNNNNITAVSHSASFVGNIEKDQEDRARITMVRIPYAKLTKHTEAYELGKGLDDIYRNNGQPLKNSEQRMFDAMKLISDRDELDATLDNEIRGNIFANTQKRINDIKNVFNNSFDKLKVDNLNAKNTFKVDLINGSYDFRSSKPAVIDYNARTTGFVFMREKDLNDKVVGNVALGFAESKFKFEYDSKEKIHSLFLNAGLESTLSKNLKLYTNGNITVNRHKSDRKIHLSNGIYKNKSLFPSTSLELTNKLRYQFGNEKLNGSVYGSLDFGYTKVGTVRENGDGMELEVKSKNIFSIKPSVGMNLAYNYNTDNGGKIILAGNTSLEFNNKEYKNKARVIKSDADYYNLEKMDRNSVVGKIGAEVSYETKGGFKVGLGVSKESRKDFKATRYSVTASYKF